MADQLVRWRTVAHPIDVAPPETGVPAGNVGGSGAQATESAVEGRGVASVMSGQGSARAGGPHIARYHWLLVLLLLASVLLRLVWLDRPDGALIFDEKYYVNAARVIAGIQPQQGMYSDARPGLDPNTEHPPLAKLVVATSIRLLGDNAYGWRIPSVLAGTAAIILMFRVGRRLGGPSVGLLAAVLLSLDNLVFVHSRIFTLDIFVLVFLLLALDWYLANHPGLAGVGLTLAALCKISGAFGLLALIGFEVLLAFRGPAPWSASARPALGRLARLATAFLLSFLLLLTVLDRVWVGYGQPLEHVARIVSYGREVRRQMPSGIESYPWQWLWNDVQIPYLRVEQQVKAGDQVLESRPVVLFLGAMNPYVLLLLPLALPFVAVAWWSRRPGGELGALALAWFGSNYLPYVAASLVDHRISYLFYFLPVLPAVALAGGYFLLRAALPRAVVAVYLVAVLAAFSGYFPFKLLP